MAFQNPSAHWIPNLQDVWRRSTSPGHSRGTFFLLLNCDRFLTTAPVRSSSHSVHVSAGAADGGFSVPSFLPFLPVLPRPFAAVSFLVSLPLGSSARLPFPPSLAFFWAWPRRAPPTWDPKAESAAVPTALAGCADWKHWTAAGFPEWPRWPRASRLCRSPVGPSLLLPMRPELGPLLFSHAVGSPKSLP